MEGGPRQQSGMAPRLLICALLRFLRLGTSRAVLLACMHAADAACWPALPNATRQPCAGQEQAQPAAEEEAGQYHRGAQARHEGGCGRGWSGWVWVGHGKQAPWGWAKEAGTVQLRDAACLAPAWRAPVPARQIAHHPNSPLYQPTLPPPLLPMLQARMREQGVAAEHGHKRERQEPAVPADVPRALHRFFKK